jgi:hypothetical protein
VDTSDIVANGQDPIDGLVIPRRTTWNDTGSASELAEKEYYYTMQAVYNSGKRSSTSRTVGKYTRMFSEGISTFSLPLEPFSQNDIEYYCQNMNADYIKWIDISNHGWMQHDMGSGANITDIEIGKGYEIYFSQKTKYTFCGMPGAMILYNDASFGFNTSIDSNAKSLNASVNSISDTVVLEWDQPESMGSLDEYHILRANRSDGFWGTLGVDYEDIATLPYDTMFYLDEGNATVGSEHYYMIVPMNTTTGDWGVSSYSIGVFTMGYFQYGSFALPLKPLGFQTADWFCDIINNTVGINYFDSSYHLWFWHSKVMPEGAFDTTIEFGFGYQISASASTKYHFIGI